MITLRLYDPIDSWGGDWGVSAKEFVSVLDELPDDTTELRLLINSPGGEVWEGLAVLNALRAHPAKVVAVVEGIAASSASFIAAGVDELHVMKNAELFIHRAWGGCIGNAQDMAKMTDDLQHEDRNIASIYADKVGGRVEDWLAEMSAETFYSAEEAVDAGIADRVIDPPKGGGDAAAKAKARFDLSALRAQRPPDPAAAQTAENTARPQVTAAQAARRIHAAAVKTPAADPATGPSTTTEGAAEMQFTDEERAGLRARFGLAADAGDDAIKAALLAPSPSASSPSAQPSPQPAPDPGPDSPQPAAKNVTAGGQMVIDQAAWDAQQETIRRLEAAEARRRREERDQVIAQAVQDGKFPPARKPHYERAWDADPEGARELIAGLARNVVPMAAMGYAGDIADADFDIEFAGLFPPARKVA